MPDALSKTLGSRAPAPAVTRYTLTTQALHWLTVPLVLAILPVAWVMMSLPRDPQQAWLFVAHRSLGMTLLAVVAVRLARLAPHPPPALPGGSSPVMELVGRLTHWLLYALLLLMPATGYLQSGNGRPVSHFGLFNFPALPENKVLGAAAQTAHLLGQSGDHVPPTARPHLTVTADAAQCGSLRGRREVPLLPAIPSRRVNVSTSHLFALR